MKIKYFKLENYAGIKYGINQNILELKDIPSGIIKLEGQNGCGKSTTLHTLHIFSDDKSFLIKNEEDNNFIPASKELIIEHNGNEYKIIHQYNAKGSKKSFIQKNNEELNENGNVTTFEEVVYKEFGIIDNKVNNSVTGVSDIHFIDLTSAERKKEIASLLPNIESYEKSYKTANDSLNGSKKHLQMLSKLITEHGSEEDIEALINDIKTKIEPINKEIQDIDQKVIDTNAQKAIKESKIVEIQNTNKNIEEFLFNNRNTFTSNEVLIENLKETPKELDLNVLNAKKDVLINNMNSKQESINRLSNEANNMNNEWNNYIKTKAHNDQIQTNRNNLINQIEALTNEINLNQDELNKLLGIESKNYFNKETLDHILRVGISIKNELESLKNSYTYSIDEKNELEIYSDIKTINEKISLFQSKQKELEKLNSYITLFSNMSNNTNNTELSNITLTDGCSFSKCGMQYKVLLETYKKNANDLRTMLENNNEKYLQYCAFQNIYNQYINSYNDRYELAKILNIDQNEFNVMNLPYVIQKLRTYKTEIEAYFNTANQIPDKQRYINSKIEYKNQIENNLNSMQLIELKELTFKHEDIQAKYNAIKLENEELSKLNQKKMNLDNEIKDVIAYSKLDQIKHFNEQFTLKETELKNNINLINDLTNEVKLNSDYLTSLNSLKIEKLNLIQTFNKEIEDLNSKLAVIKDNISSKNKLDSEIDERQMVINALHPTKGIPSLLVKQYLDQIENICNDILDQSFDETYKIYLENMEKDFFVRVFEKSTNRYIADVKSASSGQQAIIKLILSIALAKINNPESNIYLRLDEIDSVWDTANNMALESLLNGLHTKFGIDQVFIVTHNSSIAVCDMSIKFDREHQEYNIKRI